MALTDYGYKRAITIDHLKVDATLTDYPIMVKFDSTNFTFARVRSDGLDVRFTASDETTLLDYEVEYFDATEEKAVYHVRIPSISSSADTSFYMFYGYASESVDGQNVNGVWDFNFVMVQHMGTSLADSTINANNGTNYGSTVVEGANGNSRSFDGVNDYINLGDPIIDTATSYSLFVLTKTTQSAAYVNIIGRDDSAPNRFYRLGTNNGKGNFITFDSSANVTNNIDSATTINNDKYFNINGNFDTSYGAKLYINGNTDATGTGTTQNASGSGCSLLLGARRLSDLTEFYQGTIDEVRISNIARPDAWIKADDYNLRTYTLLSVGTETENGIPVEITGNAIFFGFNF